MLGGLVSVLFSLSAISASWSLGSRWFVTAIGASVGMEAVDVPGDVFLRKQVSLPPNHVMSTADEMKPILPSPPVMALHLHNGF